jgi:hypothetical protein
MQYDTTLPEKPPTVDLDASIDDASKRLREELDERLH